MSNIIKTIAYPFQKKGTSLPAIVTNDTAIKDSLIQLLNTDKGSRIMRPEVGVSALHYVFDPNDALLVENLRSDAATTIALYEPRVTVTNIQVVQDQEEGRATVVISYVVKATLQADSIPVTIGGAS